MANYVLEELPDVLTVREAASVLRVAMRTVYKMVQAGELPGRRLGSRVLIPKETLMRWLEAGWSEEPTEPGSEEG